MARLRGNPWASLTTVSVGFFMILLDLTIVNIAIPSMLSALHASLDEVLWVLNAYMLVLVVLLITAGRLGDIVGAKRLFIAGLVIFTVTSALCGVSSSAGELIAWRAVQGLGAAVMLPQTMTILTTSFPPEKRGAAFGVWGAVAGVATVAGPTLGGLLVTSFSWRWIFFINVPVGVLTLIAAYLILDDVRFGRRHRFDILGIALSSLGLVGLTYGVMEGQKYNWGTITGFISIPLVIGLGAALMVAFFLQQWRRQDAEPLVPFVLFRDRNFSSMNVVGALVSVGMLGFMLPVTIYLQSVLGFTALRAGLTLMPMSLLSMFVAPLAGQLADRIGGKPILAVGLLCCAGGFGGIIAVAQVDSTQWVFVPWLLLAGFGLGCTFAPMASIAMRDVEPRMAGAASGMLNTIRQLGSVIGNVAVGVVLQSELVTKLTSAAGSYDGSLPPNVRNALLNGLTQNAKSGVVTGGAPPLPPNTPPSLAAEIGRIGKEIFQHGYLDALPTVIIVPVAALVVGAIATLFARGGTTRSPQETTDTAPVKISV